MIVPTYTPEHLCHTHVPSPSIYSMNATTAKTALREPIIDPAFATAAPVKADEPAVVVGVGPTWPVTPAPEPAEAPEPDEPEPEPEEPELEPEMAVELTVPLLEAETAVPLATKPEDVLDDLPLDIAEEDDEELESNVSILETDYEWIVATYCFLQLKS